MGAMQLYVIVYVAGMVTGFEGPLDTTVSEQRCHEMAARHQVSQTYTDDTSVSFICEWRSERPAIRSSDVSSRSRGSSGRWRSSLHSAPF